LFLTGYEPAVTNVATLAVMGVSIIGVIRSVLEVGRRPRQRGAEGPTVKCACLGAVFNLPMSAITVIEDGLMIAMSAYSLAALFGGF
jgi:hypothetical protein